MGLFGGSRRRGGTKRQGGARGKSKSKGKGTRWTRFVQKIYHELKQKNPNTKLKDAMKAASKRKSEM